MMLKNKLKKIIKNKYLIAIIIFAIASVCICGILISNTSDPLTNFQGPSYIPEGYTCIANNTTTSVDKSFTFTSDQYNKFTIVVIQNPKKSTYTQIEEYPFIEDITEFQTIKKNINVNKHPITLHITRYQSVDMFHASWTCPETKLTIITYGITKTTQLETIEKMITTIQCHK